jgi:O-antigen/teichoic acid export membrane protein
MLIKNIYSRLGSGFLSSGLAVLSSVIIIRTFGVEPVGKIAYYFGLVGMFSLFTDMGTGTAYIKFLSDGIDREIINTYIILRAVLIIVFYLIVTAAYAWFYKNPSTDPYLFYLAVIITLIQLASEFFTNTLAGLRDYVFLSKVEVAGAVLLILYNIFVCLFFPNIYMLASNMVIAPLCIIAAGTFYCCRNRIIAISFPDKKSFTRYFRYSYPIAFSSIVGLFTAHFEKVMLGKMIGMKELGYYRLALGVFSGFDKIIKPITNTLFSEISFRINKSIEFIRNQFGDLVYTLNLTGAILVLLLMFISTPVVILFYDAENIRTAFILQCFALSIASRLFWRPYRHVLYAVEAHHPLAYLSIVDFIIRLGCYYLLIPLTIKGLLIGAMAIPFTEFILWIFPAGIYNIISLRERLGVIHVKGVVLRIHIPLLLIVSAAFMLGFNPYAFPFLLALFLIVEYRLNVFTHERWNKLFLPLKGILKFYS